MDGYPLSSILVVLFSQHHCIQRRQVWLFNNPKDKNNWVFSVPSYIRAAQHGGIYFVDGFYTVRPGSPVFWAGAIIMLMGFVLEMSALYYFRKTPLSQPALKGPYRVSRNPQWLGLFLVLLGSAIAAGIWIYIGILVIVAIIYHRQILDEEAACMKKYGEGYREYMERRPRYFLFF